MLQFTCISSSDGESGYQALLVLLKLIAQVLPDSCGCATIDANETVLLRNNKNDQGKQDKGLTVAAGDVDQTLFKDLL